MNRETTELTAIIFANLLDVIPIISNTDDKIDSTLLNIRTTILLFHILFKACSTVRMRLIIYREVWEYDG